jgi:hypothetical protein
MDGAGGTLYGSMSGDEDLGLRVGWEKKGWVVAIGTRGGVGEEGRKRRLGSALFSNGAVGLSFFLLFRATRNSVAHWQREREEDDWRSCPSRTAPLLLLLLLS